MDVLEEEIILDCRFVLSVKDAKTKNTTFKARIVVQGHCNKD